MQHLKLSISIIIIIFLCFSKIFSATVFEDDFETDKGWTNGSTSNNGNWQRANPEGTEYQLDVTPGAGYDALVTDGRGGNYYDYDVDGGETSILSPQIQIPSSGNTTISFYWYMGHRDDADNTDYFRVKVNGSVILEELGSSGSGDDMPSAYESFNTSLNNWAGQTIQIEIETADNSGTIIEASVDELLITNDASPVQYTLTTATTGCPEGSITLNPPGGTYDEGITVTCTASPSSGFINWSGNLSSSNPVETIYMDGSKSITANFQAECGAPTAEWVEHANGNGLFTDVNVGIGIPPLASDALAVSGSINCTEIKTQIFSSLRTIDVHPGGLTINSNFSTLNLGGGQLSIGNIITGDIWEFSSGKGITLNNDTKVKGTLYANEVLVTLEIPPDYVFENDYDLKPLEEVEKYIDEHKHLPGIPSAKEIIADGFNLGDMQAKLLEKIEELTLHMIELNKKNARLEKELRVLKEQQNNE